MIAIPSDIRTFLLMTRAQKLAWIKANPTQFRTRLRALVTLIRKHPKMRASAKEIMEERAGRLENGWTAYLAYLKSRWTT